MTLGELVVKISTDTTALKKGLADAERGLGNTTKAAGGLGTTLKNLAPYALGAGAALGGALYAAKKFTDAASNLNEAINKSSVVFGKHAATVQDFAETSGKSFGISERAANEYAGTIGTILSASGLAQDATAGMSVEVVKLAADLASFNNIPIDVALEKLRSGLVGEAEPMRTVGVLLSEAAVKSKAYEMGIAAVGAELTEGQKVQARYAVILEQTSSAQGDFARTAEGSANQQRIMAARWEELRARIGGGFLPIQQKLQEGLLAVFDTIENKIIPAIESWYKEHQPQLEAALRMATDTVGALKDAVMAFGGWVMDNQAAIIAAIAAIGVAFAWTNPVGAVLLGLGAIIAATQVLRSDITAMEPEVGKAMGSMKLSILDFLHTVLEAMLAVETFGVSAIPGFGQKVQEFLASKGLSAVAEGLDAIEREMADTRREIGYLDLLPAVGQFHNIEGAMNSAAQAARNFHNALASLIETGVPWSAIMSYQSGGTIPGPIGMPQLAVVHGGERVIPVGGGAHESRRMVGGRGGGDTIINAPNYGRYQVVLPNVRDHEDFLRQQARLLRGV